jgi:hypothetical protein
MKEDDQIRFDVWEEGRTASGAEAAVTFYDRETSQSFSKKHGHMVSSSNPTL